MRALHRVDYACLLLIVLVAISARILPLPRTVDDAFITFRYARNIADGAGFVYNADAHTLGTTTPLYTMLMAGLARLTHSGDYPLLALAVNVLADALGCSLLFLIIRQITGNRGVGLLGGLLWAINPFSVTFAIGGMETSVVILFQLATVWFCLGQRWLLAGLTAALALLTRIDSALWIAPLFALSPLLIIVPVKRQLQQSIRSAVNIWLRLAVPIQIIYGLWTIFSIAYFGSAFPNSINAKTVAYNIAPGSALITLIQTYSTPFSEFDAFGSTGAMLAFTAYIIFTVMALLYTWRRERLIPPWLAYPLIYMVVFSVANPLIFRWYKAPPLPALIVGILCGANALLIRLVPSRRAFNVLYGGLGLIWLYSSLMGWIIQPDHAPDRPAPKMAWHRIEQDYQQIGEMLRTEYGVTPATIVASADIGAIGYFSRATILDTVGLVTPSLRCYYPFNPDLLAEQGQNYAIPPGLILDALPAYLVTPESFVRAGLERLPAFKTAYGEPIIKIPTGYYGSDVRVYKLQLSATEATAQRRTTCESASGQTQ